MSNPKYKRLKTPHYEVIFPESAENIAKEAAKIIEGNYKINQRYLEGGKDVTTPVVINNLTLISNGYLTLAPAYSMLYALPPQYNTFTLYHSSWLEKLAIHEMRHKVQFNFLNRGFNRILYTFFGDTGLALGIGLSAPGWFFEGDAVFHETDIGNFGRGRLSHFTSLTKALVNSGKIPSYSQMYLGSNLRVYPNIYEMGYLLTAYMRNKYGPDILSEILEFSSTWNFILGPYAFHAGVYNKTNESIFSIYNSMMRDLKRVWMNEKQNTTWGNYSPINKINKEIYTSYESPIAYGNQTIAYKYGRFQTGSIVSISKNKSEKTILVTGNLTGNLTYNNSMIVWSEEIPDIRWDDSASIIKIYNLKTGKQSRLRLNGRILSPSISSDGRLIAAIEFEKNGFSSLVIIAYPSGKITGKIPVPEQKLWQTPRWGLNSEYVAILESSTEGKAVVLYNLKNDKIERPMRPIMYSVSDPFFYKNYILMHSDMAGTDNIFAVDILNGNMYQVTQSFAGAFQPSVSETSGEIIFSNIGKEGKYLSKVPFETKEWSVVKESSHLIYSAFHENIIDKYGEPENKPSGAGDLKTENYPDFIKAFNFHTRFIDPLDYLFNSNISVSLTSANVVQTHFIQLFYSYNTSEDIHSMRGEWVFRGWFPVFRLGGYYGFNYASDIEFRETYYNKQWNETGGYLNASLPLRFINGKLEQYIEPGTMISYSDIENYYINETEEHFENHSGFRNSWYLSYILKFRGNAWLFNAPYFNFGLKLNYAPDFLVFNETREFYEGSFLMEIPGLYYNHKITLMASGSYRQDSLDHTFISSTFIPRGFSSPNYSEFYLASVDYLLPLFYPDLDIAHIVFLRQVSLNLFYEHIWYLPSDPPFNEYAGTDILFHINLFEIKSEIIIGARFIYYPDPDEFVYSIDPVLNLSINTSF
jgi:hypothetical protein